MRTKFAGADFSGTDLSLAQLPYADLTDALLIQTNLTRAVLDCTNLTGASLLGVRGLTQVQLDQACADPTNPPSLDGDDADTGEPLVWRGPPCDDKED